MLDSRGRSAREMADIVGYRGAVHSSLERASAMTGARYAPPVQRAGSRKWLKAFRLFFFLDNAKFLGRSKVTKTPIPMCHYRVRGVLNRSVFEKLERKSHAAIQDRYADRVRALR